LRPCSARRQKTISFRGQSQANGSRQYVSSRPQDLDVAKTKGLKGIPNVFAENLDPEMNRNDNQMLLSEAARLIRVKQPDTADFQRFWERDKTIRSGNAEAITELRAERKAEGEAAKRVGSKGKTEQLVAKKTAQNEDEAATQEAAATAPEEGETEVPLRGHTDRPG
jgi:hypothetical protein